MSSVHPFISFLVRVLAVLLSDSLGGKDRCVCLIHAQKCSSEVVILTCMMIARMMQ